MVSWIWWRSEVRRFLLCCGQRLPGLHIDNKETINGHFFLQDGICGFAGCVVRVDLNEDVVEVLDDVFELSCIVC